MIIRLKPYTETELKAFLSYFNERNIVYQYHPESSVVVVPGTFDTSIIDKTSIVDKIIEIDTPYQLASKKWKNQTSFDVKGVTVGKNIFNVIAGPCSVESEEQIFATAEFLSTLGVKFIRGGAYKPRTSPYSFKGLGKEGLKLLHKAAQQYDLRVVTEILDLSLLDEVYQYADILQVGSRNMQNFYMLGELGKIDKPVLLKRGMQAKSTEWLLAAEYLLSGGNEKIILCERGIRSFDPATRNVMDIGIIPLIKELSHLPVIADPSHGTGNASRVTPMALAAAAAGADGIIVEVHPDPAKALSDSQQSINFNQFESLLKSIKGILKTVNRVPDCEPGILKKQTL